MDAMVQAHIEQIRESLAKMEELIHRHAGDGNLPSKSMADFCSEIRDDVDLIQAAVT